MNYGHMMERILQVWLLTLEVVPVVILSRG